MFKPSILLAKSAVTAIEKLFPAMLPLSQAIDAMLACVINSDAPLRSCHVGPESEAITSP